jgi:hypothetical protein
MELNNETSNTPKSTPRLKAAAMAADGSMSIGIGEKGGISVYGLGRFPVTLYKSQWMKLLDDEVIAEVVGFIEKHSDKLAEERVAKTTGSANGDKVELLKVNPNELAILAAEAQRCTEAGDIPGAIKYATLKGVVEASGGKATKPQMLEILQLTVRAQK